MQITNDSVAVTRSSRYRILIRDSYLRQNVLLLSANMLTGVFAYLLHPVLGQTLGLAGYGTVAALIALSSVFLTPVQIVSTVSSKFAASLHARDNHAQLNDLIRRLTLMLLPFGAVVAIAFMAVSSYVATFFHLHSSEGVVLLGVIFVVSFAAPINLGALGGLQRFGWVSVITLLPLLLRLVLAGALVLMGFGISGAVLGIVLSTIIAYLVSFMPLRDILGGERQRLGSLRPLWSYSTIAALSAVGAVLLYNLDTVLARHYLANDSASLYAALATIGKIVLFVSSSVGIVMFPRVAALHERGERHTRVLLQALLGVLALSASVEAIFLLVPSLVVHTLFGAKFMAIAGQVPWYGLAMLLLAASQIFTTYFLAVGKRAFVLLVFACCCLQVTLFIARHASVAQLVQSVVAANALLFVALMIMLAVDRRRGNLPA